MQRFNLGTVVSIPLGPFGWPRHPGVVVGWNWDGQPIISHCSRTRGVVAEEPLDAFACGQPVRVDGYPGKLPAWEVGARARERLGRPWDVFAYNCEHHVRYAHGLPVTSPQLWTAAAVLVAAGLFLRAGGRFRVA